MRTIYISIFLLILIVSLSSSDFQPYKTVKIKFKTITVVKIAEEHRKQIRLLENQNILHRSYYDTDLYGVNLLTGDTVYIPVPANYLQNLNSHPINDEGNISNIECYSFSNLKQWNGKKPFLVLARVLK